MTVYEIGRWCATHATEMATRLNRESAGIVGVLQVPEIVPVKGGPRVEFSLVQNSNLSVLEAAIASNQKLVRRDIDCVGVKSNLRVIGPVVCHGATVQPLVERPDPVGASRVLSLRYANQNPRSCRRLPPGRHHNHVPVRVVI